MAQSIAFRDSSPVGIRSLSAAARCTPLNYLNLKSDTRNHGVQVGKTITGYSIYSRSAKLRTQKNTLVDTYPPLPNQKFDIIYADPPWDYRGKLQFDKGSRSRADVEPNRNIFVSSAAFKYPTLCSSELARLKVEEIANNDAILFMWATNPHLDQAMELGRAWGFQYRTVAFVWNKMIHNPGKYTLSYCELCLLFKRGKIPSPRGARNVGQLINSRRTQHSEKPVEAIRGIEKMFPSQRKIELFARQRSEGWTSWGLDVLLKPTSQTSASSSP